MTALDALAVAATRSGDGDSFYTCRDCGGAMRKTLLGGLGPLACGSCGTTRWGK